MDPLTQGALGAVLPQAIAKKPNLVLGSVMGFCAGMTADLDMFIRSDQDPLLFLEYHRQFTHSFIFIPIGGFVCAILLHWLIGKRRQLTFKQSMLFCTLGYATHALLDASTSYGTMLFWPFSDERISWSVISIVDPLFTLPILILAVISGVRKNRIYSWLALIWAILYMSTGMIQRDRAIEVAKVIAKNRGHELVRIDAKPSFANILVWKTIYETSDRFYVDGVRMGIASSIFVGASLPKLDLTRDFPWLEPKGQQQLDIERFRWFSDSYIAKDPSYSDRIIDIRYSILPNDISALWSIKLSPSGSKSDHIEYITNHAQISVRFKKLLKMVLGKD